MQEGVTTAIVGFLLLCVAFPHIVKSKTHYYAAFFAVVIILLLGALADIIGSLHPLVGFVTALLQILALVSLLLSAGGLSTTELLGEMRDAVGDIRRGEPKDVIVPIRGQMPQPKRPVVYRDSAASAGDGGPVAYKIDENKAGGGGGGGDEESSQIPLE